LELFERELLIVQDHRRGVMAGNERVELAVVARELAVQIERWRAQRDANFLHLGGIDLVPLDEIEQGSVHALDGGSRWPQPQCDLLELPALTEFGRDRLRATAIRVNIVKTATGGGEKLGGPQELLLGEQCRQQPRQCAAALVELHGR